MSRRLADRRTMKKGTPQQQHQWLKASIQAARDALISHRQCCKAPGCPQCQVLADRYDAQLAGEATAASPVTPERGCL